MGLFNVPEDRKTELYNEITREALKRIKEGPITLGELRVRLIEYVNNKEDLNDEERKLARALVDSLIATYSLSKIGVEKIKNLDPKDVALYLFFTGFSKKEEREGDKTVIDPDYERIKELYGFTMEDIVSAVNGSVENDFKRHLEAISLIVKGVVTEAEAKDL